MKEILKHIEKRKQYFAKLEFFNFLHDKRISPTKRLAFAPSFAPFVMGFAELNQYVWRDEPTQDPIQKIINQHTYEDDSHWVWFLEDLRNLGFDMSWSFTDSLTFLWSKEAKSSRQTFYEVYRYTYKADPVHKLVVMESIEAIADIFLSTTKQVAEELEPISGFEYKYFGMNHCSSECNHSKDSDESVECISNINLEREVEKQVFELVDQTFELFTEFVDVLLENAKNTDVERNLKNKDFNENRISKFEEFSILKVS